METFLTKFHVPTKEFKWVITWVESRYFRHGGGRHLNHSWKKFWLTTAAGKAWKVEHAKCVAEDKLGKKLYGKKITRTSTGNKRNWVSRCDLKRWSMKHMRISAAKFAKRFAKLDKDKNDIVTRKEIETAPMKKVR